MASLKPKELFQSILLESNANAIFYNKIIQDHRQVSEGDIFVAIAGHSFDGHSAMNEVLPKKPAALIVEKKLNQKTNCPVLLVKSTRKALDILAQSHYGFPSKKLFCVGVTGTNGKTTTSHLIEYALNAFNIPTGVIGTIDHHFLDKKWETHLTTPGSLEFYSRLNDFVSLGARALSTEVSSHALDQDRMSSCEFDVAVFTNLTRDHLDYHKTIENYFHAKSKLFNEVLKKSAKKNKYAIINADDEFGKKILIDKEITKITYGFEGADLTCNVLNQDFSGQKIIVKYKGQEISAQLQLSGRFNVYNFLAAVGVLLAKNLPLESSVKIFESFYGVKGRLQRVPVKSETHVFVDYAHTPDALSNVLKTLNEIKGSNRVITVFGCGGDRDPGKRPLMGEIACKMSDQVIVTSDNPRTEDPQKIIEGILWGCGDQKNYTSQIDRKKAIELALGMARPGDAVVIAGKGHEDYQIIGTTKHPFDDVEVVQNYFQGNEDTP